MTPESELRDLKVDFMDAVGSFLDLCIRSHDVGGFKRVVSAVDKALKANGRKRE